jgi:hypothetical protein
MKLSGRLHAPAALSNGQSAVTIWAGPSAGLKATEEKNNARRELNPGPPTRKRLIILSDDPTMTIRRKIIFVYLNMPESRASEEHESLYFPFLWH